MDGWALAIRSVFGIVTVLGLALAYVLWRNREAKGALALSVTACSASVWSGSLLAQTFVGEALFIQLHRLMYVGIVLTIPALLVFALEYTGREQYVTRTVLGLLSIHPVLTMAFVTINPGELFLGSLEATGTLVGYQYGWAPVYIIHLLYTYVIPLAVIVMILEFVLKSKRTLYRGQAIALLFAIIIPVGLNILYMANTFVDGQITVDITPIGLLVSVALFTVAIVQYELTNVTPVAREKVIDNVRDGILVVDPDGTIAESNPAARRLFGKEEELIGANVTDLFEEIPALLEWYESLDKTGEVSKRVTYGDQHIMVKTTPVTDNRDDHVGCLLLLQDVTERVRRERDLEQQIEKLDQFASIVSHDLRNPLNVARGFAQQTRATGELDHLDKTDDALERMEDIIEDVLALTREGQDITDPGEASLGTIAERAWKNVDTAGAQLELTEAAGDALIIADGDRLQRLLENLFRNSVEHGVDGNTDEFAAGHRVTVDTRDETHGTVTVVVSDTGVGIPPDEREKVLEDGYTTGGTGLGLSIVQQIADAHDWEITVTESESGGAAFELSNVGKPLGTVRTE